MNRFLLALAGLLTLTVVGCTDDSPPTEGSESIAVTSSNDECILDRTEAPSGTLVFNVENTGDEATEFYFLEEDGETVVSEVENIGPGVSRPLTVEAAPGTYVTACKPGMVGDGIRAEFTVTGTEG